MAKNELMVVDNFALTTNEDIADILAEELDGLGEIPLDRVKIPSGGGVAFEIPGDDPESPDLAKEIAGIVIDHHPVNAYWDDKYDGQNTPPSCSSMDGKYGNGWDANWKAVDPETGEVIENPTCNGCCADCYFNKFGSDGNGKKCKNMHRLYILQEDSALPLILTLPPTSIKNWKNYVQWFAKRILIKHKSQMHHIITKITLKKESNQAGIAYSSAQFAFGGMLPPELKANLDARKKDIKKITRRIEIANDDYGATDTQANTYTAPANDIDTDDFVVTDAEPTFEEAPTNE